MEATAHTKAIYYPYMGHSLCHTISILGPYMAHITRFAKGGSEKRSAKIFGKEKRPKVSGNGQKCPSNFEKTQVPLE